MRIFQMLPNLSFGDAVGNDTLTLEKLIREMGYETGIFALRIKKSHFTKDARQVDEMPELKEDDILIYHYSTGDALNYKFAEYKCRKVLMYHNVTPPKFFKGHNDEMEAVCEEGLKGIRYLADKVDFVIADSEFNKSDLRSYGFTCPIDVLPILIRFEDYDQKPDKKLMRTFPKKQDGGRVSHTFLFTGRVAPNKKQEDIMAAFYQYRKLFDKDARLVFAGNFRSNDLYYERLDYYKKALGFTDEEVLFTGHIKFNQILSYFHLADAFICMSEHEGFCVPLAEAMKFKIPILAYDSTAVGETLNGSGFLVDDKDPVFLAYCMHELVTNQELRKNLIAREEERLKDFSYEVVSEQFRTLLKKYIETK